METAQENAVEFFERQCDLILEEADVATAAGELERALVNLASVPQEASRNAVRTAERGWARDMGFRIVDSGTRCLCGRGDGAGRAWHPLPDATIAGETSACRPLRRDRGRWSALSRAFGGPPLV